MTLAMLTLRKGMNAMIQETTQTPTTERLNYDMTPAAVANPLPP